MLAQPDLEALRTEMADTIHRAKADDPKELRKQLAEAQKKIRELENRRIEVEKVVTREVVKPIPNDLLKEIEHDSDFLVQAMSLLTDGGKRMHQHWLDLHHHNKTEPQTSVTVAARTDGRAALAEAILNNDIGPAVSTWPPPQGGSAIVGYDLKPPTPLGATKTAPAGSSVHPDLKFPQKRILDALAWLEAIQDGYAHWSIIAMLSQQSPKSSGFANNVSVLRVNGFLEGSRAMGLNLTARGRSIAVAPDVPLSTDELMAAIAGKISTPQVRILRYLVRKGEPVTETWEKVAEHSEQSPTSSGFANNLSVLRSMGLIRGNRASGLSAGEVLFLDGHR